MISSYRILIQLYGPLIMFIICIVSLFFLRMNEENGKISIGFEHFGLKIPVKSAGVIRILVVLIALCFLAMYLFIDYSSFFPKKFKMDVYFDDEGIQETLKTYSDSELEKLDIIKDFKSYQAVYYDDLDLELQKILSLDKFFALELKDIYSEGETTFIIKKVDGLQNYYLEESIGKLKHVLKQPEKPEIYFTSIFEKVKSPNDHIEPTLIDVYIKQEILLKPKFIQLLAENYTSKNGKIFHHTLYGATKVKFLPFPRYGHTIYLFEIENVGLIPIGYAVYRDGT
ncbi:MAG: hypothetical protein GY839_08190 [candidate division Zixibacteria bacterium]|nr:hypothetical protein [candidate division Zixibacteria bacterium]